MPFHAHLPCCGESISLGQEERYACLRLDNDIHTMPHPLFNEYIIIELNRGAT